MSDPGFEPTRAGVPAVGGPGGPAGPVGPPPGRPGGPPPGEPPADRRLWIAAGVLAVVAVVLLVLLVVNSSNDDDDQVATDPSVTSSTTTSTSSTTSSTSSTTTSTTEATTTTESTTTTTEAPPVTNDTTLCREAGANPSDPEPAARAVFDAWTRGDDACAAELMAEAALDDLFSRSGTDAQDVFQGCFENTDGDPYMDCAFTYEGGSTHYRMNFSPTDGWQVYEVYQVAD